MSSGNEVDVQWMSSGCHVSLTTTWLNIASLTGSSDFSSAYDWLNRNKVAAPRISHGKKMAWNRGLWLAESPKSRLLIGREPPQKCSKGIPLQSKIFANDPNLSRLFPMEGVISNQQHNIWFSPIGLDWIHKSQCSSSLIHLMFHFPLEGDRIGSIRATAVQLSLFWCSTSL